LTNDRPGSVGGSQTKNNNVSIDHGDQSVRRFRAPDPSI
jgi:hypothetical protein